MYLTFGIGDADPSGMMVPPKEQVTAQNYDMQFGTNVIGKYLLFFDRSNGLSMYNRSLAIHANVTTCLVRSYGCITHPRESTHRDGVIFC
jgi:hypothetical protein